MGNLIRFLDPKREKMFIRAAESAKEAIYAEVAEGTAVHIDDVTIALARSVYECFYSMQDGGRPPSQVCTEIDDFLELMNKNLPQIKKNVWRSHNE